MASYQMTAKVVKVGAVQQVSEKFKKRDLVLIDESNAQYPEYAVFQFVQDKCSLLDSIGPGETVTVEFNIKGRPSQKAGQETQYFSNLQGWKVSSNGASAASQKAAYAPPANPVEDDQLPF